MGDHPQLPLPRTITATRLWNGFDPDRGPVETDRPGHAKTLAGILAGLESALEASEPTFTASGERDTEGEEDSPFVLVIEGRAALAAGPFRKWGMTVLAEGDENTYLVLTDREARRLFAELVAQYGGKDGDWHNAKSWQDQLDAVSDVHLYGPQERKDPGVDDLPFNGVEVLDVLLWASSLERPASRRRAANERLALVRKTVQEAAERDEANREITYDDRPDATLLRVAADRELLEKLLNHPWVEKIRPPLRPTVSEDHLVDAAMPAEGPAPSGAAIGVIDDLILTAHPLLENVVIDQLSFPSGRVLNPPSQHGTRVAGVAAYGDLRPFVTQTGSLPQPHPIVGARIMHSAPMFGTPARAVIADPLHIQLERALRWLANQGVKVAVCSVNFPYPDERLLPSESAAVIDQLARELNMVVVVSAGNVDDVAPDHHWKADYPTYLDADSARVADPGGAALALTVGAVARYDVPAAGSGTTVAIARADEPSPFTRVGPTRGRGPAGTRKPEFEAHGGNLTYEPGTDRVHHGDANLGVVTLSQLGGRSSFTAVDGTSVAAPFVAHQVAKIATRYPEASANLLRALTALSGRPNPVVRSMPIDAVVSAYGQPDADTVLESDTDRVIVVFEGELPVGATAVHRLPIPSSFATGARGQQLRIALAFDPPVRRTRRVYATGDMGFSVVRAMTEEEVVRLYSRQPSRADMDANPNLEALELPRDRRRPDLEPGSTLFGSNTLVSRTMRGSWDPDDEDYFLVVQHHVRPWARAQELPATQTYAFAAELALREGTGIDLLAQVREELRLRSRARQRS